MFRDRRSPAIWGANSLRRQPRASHPPSPSGIGQLIVFGDSFSDTGAGYVDSNGPTAVFHLARGFGLDLLPAGAAAVGKKASRNYAVSGAGSDASPGGLVKRHILGRGLQIQVQDMKDDLEGGRVMIDAHTVFFIAIGLNEGQRPTDETIGNLLVAIEALYAMGARYIVLATVPERLPEFPDVGQRLNPAYRALASELPARLPGLRCLISEWGAFFDAIREAPRHYQIANVTDPCCSGRALFGEVVAPRADPDRYFYYHPGHPSAAVHRLVGERLAAEMNAWLRG
ncbi:SGNH/GDSL hydrolase family protein [Sphingomonas sp.]|uniref:SGNH/GDSL hydrolase family protein n=1 Tax=Sphingomonas sp. TaxID=28214 RepID=UPI0025EC4B96|nr:SGNH/GDSL hydrolase family protein [Sphingomonas sp.]